ncbi:MAG: helix-turn-helix transcriptional regulator [Kutzneria sp.]|nr:helix-turn-helix transcriptional regulator [Kutzneria sp.]MBV9843580.1 helix-turn-helix transcriptional regulator [Kutzneria sp.]
MHCSLARGLEIVGDWWSPLILRDLYLGIDRFDALVTDLGLSRNVLTDRLESLIRGGVVAKVADQHHPRRGRYMLTEAGRELMPILMAMTAWGDKWAASDDGPPLFFHHDRCGEQFVPTVRCSSCGQKIDAAEVTARPGPGGKTAPGTMLVAAMLADGAGQPNGG